jgi:hypothetical protein
MGITLAKNRFCFSAYLDQFPRKIAFEYFAFKFIIWRY